MNISYQVKKLIISLEKELESLEKKLRKLPEEELFCFKNGKYYSWIRMDNITKERSYIKKRERDYAELLALKKYYSSQYKRRKRELSLLNDFISKQGKIKEEPNDLLDENSPYSHLLRSKLSSFSDSISSWENTSFDKNLNYPEHLIHKTLKGHFVRSKSEAIIANTLFLNNIPYHYEAGLHIEDITFFPDFTICHPETLDIIYWEHFGLMDKPQYREKTFYKLREYGNYGIIPSINLITTYETLDHPLDSSEINRLIKEMFLI